MEVDNFTINIKNGILIVTSKKNVTLDNLKDLKILMERSTERGYNYGMYRNALGYYDGYDFLLNISVYCSSLKESRAIEMIENYILTKK